MVSLAIAVERTLAEEQNGDWSNLPDMKSGCAHRRALEALALDDHERRKLLTDIIALESPTLYA
jgi:hypothetical protein